MLNPWDLLSEHFNGHKNLAEVDTNAADNILIAWPTIIEQIGAHFRGAKDISILDYGCGAGAFCEKLRTLGYSKVAGMDSSQAMIAVATKNYGETISFTHGLAGLKATLPPVDLITGIMVFQFAEHIEKVLSHLTKALKPGGLFIFAVHNPETVSASLQRKKELFSDFDSALEPKSGLINLDGNAIPVFIRTAGEYDSIMKGLGMQKVFGDCPPFTQEFLASYGTNVPDIPEYLILGYAKLPPKNS